MLARAKSLCRVLKSSHNKQQNLRKLIFWLWKRNPNTASDRNVLPLMSQTHLSSRRWGSISSAICAQIYASYQELLQVKSSCLSGTHNEFGFFLHKVYLKSMMSLFCNRLLWDKIKNFTNLFLLVCIHRPTLHSPSLTYYTYIWRPKARNHQREIQLMDDLNRPLQTPVSITPRVKQDKYRP